MHKNLPCIRLSYPIPTRFSFVSRVDYWFRIRGVSNSDLTHAGWLDPIFQRNVEYFLKRKNYIFEPLWVCVFIFHRLFFHSCIKLWIFFPSFRVRIDICRDRVIENFFAGFVPVFYGEGGGGVFFFVRVRVEFRVNLKWNFHLK